MLPYFNHNDELPDNIEVLRRLKLPKANDKIWQTFDEDLSRLDQLTTKEDPGEGLKLLEAAVYDYLEEIVGTTGQIKEQERKKSTQGPNKDAECRRLRDLKKSQRKAYERVKRKGKVEEMREQKVEYLKLVRLHNNARKMALKKEKKKSMKKACTKFLENPYEYGKKVLSDKKEGDTEPTFDAEKATDFFTKEYQDLDRKFMYNTPEELDELQESEVPCNVEPPTLEEFKEKLKSRRNKSAPGANGVPYLVYKKCPGLAMLLYLLICRIWKMGKMPDQWKTGVGILLPKTDDLGDPAKFRNLTLLNCSGKLLTALWADRVLDYMTRNKYINKTVQKGFMKKTPGCLEHSQALMEELRDAKTKRRQLFVVFIDLQNAYGRVPHSLIIFALKRYHLPQQFINLILNYYDRLLVCIKTRKWCSKSFWYEVGLFQGDPLSVILFLIVFNILLEMLDKYKSLGYKPSFSSDTSSKKAFADDLTLLAKTLKGIKQLLEVVEGYLKWTRNMKAKPEKSLTLAMKRIDGKYTSFDPELTLGGSLIPSIDKRPMKFLGMWIYVNLDVGDIKNYIKEKLVKLFEVTSEDVITGPMKAWIYNNLIVPKMSWDFLVYNLPITYVKELGAICNRYLKQWLGIAHPCTISVLYRSRDCKGLQLKNMVTEYKVIQLGKGDQLYNSKDPYIKEVVTHRSSIEGGQKNWSYTKELEDRKRQKYFKELVGPPAVGKRGLGSDTKYEAPSDRKVMSEMIRSYDEETLLISLHSMKRQNKFLTWENAMAFDTTWKSLLYQVSPALLKFHLNAIHDTLPTPSNLKLWNKASTGRCGLCGHYGTLAHILTFCSVSLNQGRYNWRHDQVLRVIVKPVLVHVDKVNADTQRKKTPSPMKTVFHKSGDKNDKVHLKVPFKARRKVKEFVSGAKDWVVVFDEDKKQRNFPQHIASTPLRPDVVIFSNTTKKVLIMELTCGNEDNFVDQHQRKTKKYEGLVQNIEANEWTCKFITVEVGARGIYNDSLPAFFNLVGLDPKVKKLTSERAAETSVKASYTIYLSRTNKIWSDNWELAEYPRIQDKE